MAHTFKFEVSVTVERTEGKFASRDEISQALLEELEGAEPYGVDGVGADGMTSYEVTEYEVNEA